MKKSGTFLIVFTSFLMLMPISAQTKLKIIDDSERKYEMVDVAYLANELNNQRTSPANKDSKYHSVLRSHTTVTTVQVNVNSSGQNIIGGAVAK